MRSEVNLIGHVAEIFWYELEDGRVVSVHVAEDEGEGSTTFISDNKTFPSITANREDISYDFLRNAMPDEADAFFADHPELIVKRTIPTWKLGA